jgi:hypothetical protein
MIGILQAAISGVLLGFGVGAGLFEMWTVSISVVNSIEKREGNKNDMEHLCSGVS